MAEKSHRNSLQPDYKLHWYSIKVILGQGGFGITYLAHDLNLDEDVAIKEYLPTELAVRETDHSVHPVSENRREGYQWGLDKFIEEARTLARFKHPNIVRVRSVFEENNTAYMVMDYEQGQGLQELLSGKKTLAEADLMRIMLPIMDGLQKVHEAGFIHRDIKPANIFVRQNHSPVLLDFGSARQALGVETKTLTSLVTPGYAPIEQYFSSGSEQGPWTDIYGLAATMYRAIIGKAPLDAVDRSKAIINTNRDTFALVQELARGRYSERFLRTVDHGLNFKREERPLTINDWRREFENPAPAPARNTAVTAAKVAETTMALHPPDQVSQPQPPAVALPRTVRESPAPAMPAGRPRQESPPEKNTGSRFWKYAALLLAIIVLVGWYSWRTNQAHQAELAQQRNQAEQAAAAAAARQRRLEETRQQVEQDQWNAAKAANTPAAYQRFLAAWPDGAHADKAKSALAELDAEKRDRLAAGQATEREIQDTTRQDDTAADSIIKSNAPGLTPEQRRQAVKTKLARLAAAKKAQRQAELDRLRQNPGRGR